MQIPNTVPPLRPLLSHRAPARFTPTCCSPPPPSLSLLLSRCVQPIVDRWIIIVVVIVVIGRPILFPMERRYERFPIIFADFSILQMLILSVRSWKESASRMREFFLLFSRIFDSIIFTEEFFLSFRFNVRSFLSSPEKKSKFISIFNITWACHNLLRLLRFVRNFGSNYVAFKMFNASIWKN